MQQGNRRLYNLRHLITLKTGPQREVLEFIVNTKTKKKTCVVNITKECNVCSSTVKMARVGEEKFEILSLKV